MHDRSNLCRIKYSPSTRWRITFVILQTFEVLWVQSFKGSMDCVQNHSNLWRIECNPSKVWRIVSGILQPFEGLKDICFLQRGKNDVTEIRRGNSAHHREFFKAKHMLVCLKRIKHIHDEVVRQEAWLQESLYIERFYPNTAKAYFSIIDSAGHHFSFKHWKKNGLI